MTARIIIIVLLSYTIAAMAQKESAVGHMYDVSERTTSVIESDHHLVFRGEKDKSGYNNHAYLAHHDGRFWAMWSCAPRDGGHPGQEVRFATSKDGVEWSESSVLAQPAEGLYSIARGLWVRNGELLALSARCRGKTTQTVVEALEVRRWDENRGTWVKAGEIGEKLINNFAPILTPGGNWLMPYRERELNRVDGVLIGGVKDVGAWQRVKFPGSKHDRFTEADPVIRADGSIAVHLRDNNNEGFLFRSISTDGGKSFTEPVQTNFPDCKSKHYCFKLNNGIYLLINNPESRKTLRVSGSADGKVFTSTAILRRNPTKTRNPGHDKSPSFTYPHAIERDGAVYVIYAVNRDDIAITRVPVRTIKKTLGQSR